MTYMPLMKKKVPTSTFSVFFFSSSFYVFPNLEFVAQCRVQSKLIFLFYLNFHALYLIKLSSKLTCISYQNSWLCIFLCEDVRICRAQFHEKKWLNLKSSAWIFASKNYLIYAISKQTRLYRTGSIINDEILDWFIIIPEKFFVYYIFIFI